MGPCTAEATMLWGYPVSIQLQLHSEAVTSDVSLGSEQNTKTTVGLFTLRFPNSWPQANTGKYVFIKGNIIHRSTTCATCEH